MPNKSIAVLVAAASLTLGAAACGSSDIEQSKFASELQKKADLTRTQSTCVARKVYAEFDQSVINDLYSANAEEDLPKGVPETFRGFVRDCTTDAPG